MLLRDDGLPGAWLSPVRRDGPHGGQRRAPHRPGKASGASGCRRVARCSPCHSLGRPWQTSARHGTPHPRRHCTRLEKKRKRQGQRSRCIVPWTWRSGSRRPRRRWCRWRGDDRRGEASGHTVKRFVQERLVIRTDGALPWCCLPHVLSQVYYDGPRERCAPRLPARAGRCWG